MARKCTVCQHPDREAIDRMIVTGQSIREIMGRFPGLSKGAVHRHMQNHATKMIPQAVQAELVTQADSILGDLLALYDDARYFLELAKLKGDVRGAAPLIASVVRVLELLGEVRQELNRSQTINIVASPEYLQMRARIIAAVRDCPECRRKLSEALQ